MGYINPKTTIFIYNTEILFNKLDRFFEKATTEFNKINSEIKHLPPAQLFLNQTTFIQDAVNFCVVELGSKAIFRTQKTFDFSYFTATIFQQTI